MSKKADDGLAKQNTKGCRHFDQKEVEDISSVLSYFSIFNIYITYTVVLSFGIVLEFIRKIMCWLHLTEDVFACPKGYAPLLKVKNTHYKISHNLKQLDYFWLRHAYQRIRDCFERPIVSVAGSWIDVRDRVSHDYNLTYE